MDRYLFGKGTHYQIYDKLGAHPLTVKGKKGYYFAVWAPHAKSVSVIGGFNGWDGGHDPMHPLETSGIFECFVPGAAEGDLYKYQIVTWDGRCLEKADPYAFSAELRPGTASRLFDLSRLSWHDDAWMAQRPQKQPQAEPMAIYECHLASWRYLNGDPAPARYSYRGLAPVLASYLKELGYTHLELIGIAEYPFDGSWGYQVTGYYAPTARYGGPEDFAWFVDYMHQAGISVILDWVPAHFPRDAHGLAEFDGQPLYEYADPRKGEHAEWGTKIFDYGRTEVSNFLIANALYWVEKYHIDGLRVDAVASMLYLDYGRKAGEWVPNQYGGNQNLEAVEFFRHLNSILQKRNPGAVTIAEESTAWAGVTAAPEESGLGFTFKWNMGWMHDFLHYMQQDPIYRKPNHYNMTFGITYAWSEHFILVLSHDEVVHLKGSMLEKMPGCDADKFAGLKAGYAFMIGHPGKKLLFMGQEFGQRREWSEERDLDWWLLQQPEHAALKDFWRDLLTLYRKNPVLYESDQDPQGFEWINADDAERSIYSFCRLTADRRHGLLFVINFTPVDRPDYRVGVPGSGRYSLQLDQTVGLYRRGTKKPVFQAVHSECDGRPYSFAYPLPGYGIAVFRFSCRPQSTKKD